MNKEIYNEINSVIENNKTSHLTIMHDKIVNLKFKTVVEFGVDRGTSTAAFLIASDKVQCKVYSFDTKDCSKIYKHENWNFLKINDLNKDKILEMFPEIKSQGIDILYIDSYHEPNHVKKLLELYFPLININGYIFVDDTCAYPFRKINILTDSINSDLCKEAVEEFFFSNHKAIDFFYHGNENGLSVLKKKIDITINEKPIWKYNFLIYYLFKIIKKIKYKLFY